MNHLFLGRGIRLLILQKNCSAQCSQSSSKFPPENMRNRHCFEIWVIYFSISVSPHRDVYVVFITELSTCLL